MKPGVFGCSRPIVKLAGPLDKAIGESRFVTLSVPFHSFRPTDRDALLAPRLRNRQRLAKREEPQAVVNQSRIASEMRLLEVLFSRSTVRRSSSWCAVTTRVPPEFHTPCGLACPQPVFKPAPSALCMLAAFLQRNSAVQSAQVLLPFYRTGVPVSTPISTLPPCPSLFRRNDPLPHSPFGAWRDFSSPPLVAEVPVVAVAAVNVFLALLPGNFVFFR